MNKLHFFFPSVIFPSFNKWYLKFATVADFNQKHNSAEEGMIKEMFSAAEGKRFFFFFIYV